ncbi:MAG: hypothetical protein CMK92_02635 [Pseudomonas sp.]|nr:hypothetical protein [Pseudomonas sp.]
MRGIREEASTHRAMLSDHHEHLCRLFDDTVRDYLSSMDCEDALTEVLSVFGCDDTTITRLLPSSPIRQVMFDTDHVPKFTVHLCTSRLTRLDRSLWPLLVQVLESSVEDISYAYVEEEGLIAVVKPRKSDYIDDAANRRYMARTHPESIAHIVSLQSGCNVVASDGRYVVGYVHSCSGDDIVRYFRDATGCDYVAFECNDVWVVETKTEVSEASSDDDDSVSDVFIPVAFGPILEQPELTSPSPSGSSVDQINED